MDRINEMLIGGITVVGGFLTKRIFSRQDQLEERISALEKLIVTKQDLDPIERNVDLILTHILNTKK